MLPHNSILGLYLLLRHLAMSKHDLQKTQYEQQDIAL